MTLHSPTTVGRQVTIRLIAVLAMAIFDGAAPSDAVATGVPGVAWDVAFVAQPTNLPLTRYHFNEPRDQYVLALTNTGKQASTGPTALTITLPAGITLARPVSSPGWECPSGEGSTVLTCSYSSAIPGLGRSQVLTFPVAVSEAGTRTATATVSGGAAPTAVVSRSTQVGAAQPTFGFADFSALVSDVSGLTDTQASDHPFALTTIIDFP
jgi:hypothetical protein